MTEAKSTASVQVALQPRPGRTESDDVARARVDAPDAQRRQLRLIELLTTSERVRMAAFIARLAVKEHINPQLHVRPLVAELFLTDNCNLRCVSCACWRSTTRQELTTAEWRGAISQLVDLGIMKLNFTGGEPLLRKDAIGLMAYAGALGCRSLHLNTNAVLLTAERRAGVLEAGVRSFNISIDGPDGEVHDRIRGVAGSFDTSMAHLQALLLEGRRSPLRVRLNYTVQRRNVGALPEIARLAQELGVQLYLNLATDTTFLFRDLAIGTEITPDDGELRTALDELEAIAKRNPRWLPRFSDRAYIGRHFADLLQRDLPCAESQLKLMVHSTGEVGGCWAHDAHDNLRNTPIATIIDSAHYRAEHARFFRKECHGCGSNYSFNLRLRPRTYFADARAYGRTLLGLRGRSENLS